MKLTKSEIDVVTNKIIRELKEATDKTTANLIQELRDKVNEDLRMLEELTKGISLNISFSVESFPNDYPNYFFNEGTTDWSYKNMINKSGPSFDQVREDVVLSMIGAEFNVEDLIKTIKAKYEN